MSYICERAITLNGNNYWPGDSIPDGAVLPERADRLKSYGYIVERKDTKADAGGAAEAIFMVPISPVAEDGEHLEGIPATESSVAAMALVLMLTAEDASKAIREMEDETALTLVQALDSRKSVKNAAAARLKEIQGGDA